MRQFVCDEPEKLIRIRERMERLEKRAEHLDKKKFEVMHSFVDFYLKLDSILIKIDNEMPKLADYVISFNPKLEHFRSAIAHNAEFLEREFTIEEDQRDTIRNLGKELPAAQNKLEREKGNLKQNLENQKIYIEKEIYDWLDRFKHALEVSKRKLENKEQIAFIKDALKFIKRDEKKLRKIEKIIDKEIKELR